MACKLGGMAYNWVTAEGGLHWGVSSRNPENHSPRGYYGGRFVSPHPPFIC